MQKTKAEQNLRVNMLQGPDMASGADEEAEDGNPAPDGSKSERGLVAKMKGRHTNTSSNSYRNVACNFASVLISLNHSLYLLLVRCKDVKS